MEEAIKKDKIENSEKNCYYQTIMENSCRNNDEKAGFICNLIERVQRKCHNATPVDIYVSKKESNEESMPSVSNFSFSGDNIDLGNGNSIMNELMKEFSMFNGHQSNFGHNPNPFDQFIKHFELNHHQHTQQRTQQHTQQHIPRIPPHWKKNPDNHDDNHNYNIKIKDRQQGPIEKI